MLRYIALFCVLLSICNLKIVRAEKIWNTSFDISDKGVWMTGENTLISDLNDVDWTLDWSECSFKEEGDYAKTVSTSGGRFEVLDSDGELVWISPWIKLDEYKNISINFIAKEIGSGAVVSKKYIHPFYRINAGEENEIASEILAEGNWGEVKYSQVIEDADSLQLIVKMNSSYSNDKVILDEVEVFGDLDVELEPAFIGDLNISSQIIKDDTIVCEFGIFSMDSILIKDDQYEVEVLMNLPAIGAITFNNGIYQISFLAEAAGNYELSIQNEKLSLQLVAMVEVLDLDDFLFYEDFESGLSNYWTIDGWQISVVEPVEGTKSLQHQEGQETGLSRSIFSGQSYNLNDGSYSFNYTIRNGNWDPSSSNGFYLSLSGTDIDLNPMVLIVGVNYSGSTDLLSVWTKIGDEIELLKQSELDWEPEMEIAHHLERNNKGEWSIALKSRAGESEIIKFEEKQLSVLKSIELAFKYTSTRSGKLWFDNFYAERTNVGPYVLHASNNSEGALLFFNEEIKESSVLLTQFKYRIQDGDWQSFEGVESVSDREVQLKIAGIDAEKYELKVEGVLDMEGTEMESQIVMIDNISEALEHDIVLNEIMADPVPSVGLPEVEYIELYNRSTKFLQLENWILNVGGMEVVLHEYLLRPDEYVLLLDVDYVDEFSSNVPAITFNTFPILKNGGASVLILNSKRKVIDELNYSDAWYNNEEKDNGGWSLERLDPERFCGVSDNWTAAEVPIGGSPGGSNSIHRSNIDNEAPGILCVETKTYNEVVVYFSEVIDVEIDWAPYIELEGEKNDVDDFVFIDDKELKVSFKKNFVANKNYQLNISSLTDQCGNVADRVSGTFSIIVLEAGQIVINEVLFNPFTGASDFVEIYNQSGLTIDLSKIYIATRDDSLKLKSVYPLCEIKQNWDKEEYLVVSKDTTSILDNYYVPNAESLIEMAKFPSFPDKSGRVVLIDDSMRILDEFFYDEGMHSDYLSVKDGVTLERVNRQEETYNENNWRSASSIVGYATPSYKNSQASEKLDGEFEVEVFPEVLSPNDDGVDDELHIKLRNIEPNSLVNIYLFDAMGQLKYQLKNNELLGVENEIIWNGKDTSNACFSRGPYIILIEILMEDGKREVMKKSFYLAS